MIKEIINQFRRDNGRHPLAMDNWQENEFCLFHCKHMAEIQDCRHAPEHFRQGKSEGVAVRGFFKDHYETLRAIVFEDFASSMKHRDIILFNDNLACAFHAEHNCIFLTVRGW